MCQLCRSYPCNPSCPNAPAPPAFGRCKWCKDEILAGDEYVDLDGDYYHVDCFDDAAVEILYEEYGAIRREAEVDSFVGIGF